MVAGGVSNSTRRGMNHESNRDSVLAITVWLPIAGAAEAEDEGDLLAITLQLIHERAIVIDSLVDIPPDFATEAYDPVAAKAPRQKLDLPGMEQGGLDAAFFVVCATAGAQSGEHAAR